MERLILKEVTQFFDSEDYRAVAKHKNSRASKLRNYKSKNEKGELTAKAALMLLMDMGRVTEIYFKK